MDTKSYVKKHRIRADVTLVDHNPNMADDDWSRTANHWRVVLKRGKRQRMTVPFSMGPALLGKPTAADVLDCLASDAAGYVNRSPFNNNEQAFEDWASEYYGYDTDSRAAKRTYKAIEQQTEELRRFLGDELFRQLLDETERL